MNKISCLPSIRTKHVPPATLTLTGKSFFIPNRKEVDVTNLNIEAGDIIIYCIKGKRKASTESNYGQIRGLVYDGKRLCHVFLYMFLVELGFSNVVLLKSVAARASSVIAKNKGNEILYKRGYHLKSSTCHRCGWCCIECGVPIVRPEFVDTFEESMHSSKMIIFKHDNVPCPHLAWDNDDKACCKIHHRE